MDLLDLHTGRRYPGAATAISRAPTMRHAAALAFAGPSPQPVSG